MAQITDLNAASRKDVARVLLAVADHFTEVDPTADLEQHSLLISFGAEAYRLTHGKPGHNADGLSAAAFGAAPQFVPGVTRGEYALILRRALTEAGHDWPDGDNDPAIPRIPGIPGPRTEPTPAPRPKIPAQPEQSDDPTCCGKPMTRDGQQWVCGNCKGWHDLDGGK